MYLLNIFATAAPKRTKRFKSYISILAIVNYQNWLVASPPFILLALTNVNASYISLNSSRLFSLQYKILLFKLFYHMDRFLHHLVGENKGRVTRVYQHNSMSLGAGFTMCWALGTRDETYEKKIFNFIETCLTRTARTCSKKVIHVTKSRRV